MDGVRVTGLDRPTNCSKRVEGRDSTGGQVQNDEGKIKSPFMRDVRSRRHARTHESGQWEMSYFGMPLSDECRASLRHALQMRSPLLSRSATTLPFVRHLKHTIRLH